jgi:hypothetical protein
MATHLTAGPEHAETPPLVDHLDQTDRIALLR